ncbi:MAG: small, acid-soluble spore protein, alpha/beta type [Syntrophothermus sp.]
MAMIDITGEGKLLPDQTLETLKYGVAERLGLDDDIRQKGWGRMTTQDCGRIGGKMGGSMVKVLIRNAENALVEKYKNDH